MIPYGKQSIDDDDIDEIIKTLKSDYLTTGPKINEFEEKFAKYIGVKYAVAVSSGTAALHLGCLATDLKKGEEIITSPMTFAASANCALYCDATPRFVDITDQGLIDIGKIEEKITEKTKILIPVDYSGLPCEMDKINNIAQENDLIVIEDSCHALGSKYKNKIVGNCQNSDMCIFSFHPVKHITTGEGGMITTNSEDLYNKLKTLRTHGIKSDPEKEEIIGPWYKEMQYLGYNYRLTDIQCALGISQLKRLEEFIDKRRKIAGLYNESFENHKNFDIIKENPDQMSSFHLYPILVKDITKRKIIFEYLRKKGIWVQVHYIPVYFHPYYEKLGYKKGICPRAEDFYNREISIPMYPSLTDKEIEYTIEKIFEVFEKIN